jgi:hypothetical protein
MKDKINLAEKFELLSEPYRPGWFGTSTTRPTTSSSSCAGA